MSSTTPDATTDHTGQKDPARFFIPVLAVLTVLIAVASAFGITRSSDNAMDYETTQLQNIGFSNVNVVHSLLLKNDTYANVEVAPNCELVLNWIPNANDNGGHWVYKSATNDNAGTPATSATALIEAGACSNH